MSDQQDSQELVHLNRLNVELMRSLNRCHALVDDCRAKLAANSNEPFLFANDEDEEEDDIDRA